MADPQAGREASPETGSPVGDLAEADRRELAAAVRERLVASLDEALGDLLRPTAERRDVYADGVVVTAFGLLERCPRRAAVPAQDYRDSVATARRRVGLLVLRQLWAEGIEGGVDDRVAATTAAVLADPDDWPTRLRAWVDDLDPAARAALVAGVITWCRGVLGIVGRSGDVAWADPTSTSKWDVPRRLVRLVAPVDAVTRRPRSERLLMVVDAAGPSGDRLRAGFAALAHGIGRGLLPVGVTVAVPSQGLLRRHRVTAELVDLALDRVVEHVALCARRADAPARPGPGCRHCHLLELCPEGSGTVRATAL